MKSPKADPFDVTAVFELLISVWALPKPLVAMLKKVNKSLNLNVDEPDLVKYRVFHLDRFRLFIPQSRRAVLKLVSKDVNSILGHPHMVKYLIEHVPINFKKYNEEGGMSVLNNDRVRPYPICVKMSLQFQGTVLFKPPSFFLYTYDEERKRQYPKVKVLEMFGVNHRDVNFEVHIHELDAFPEKVPQRFRITASLHIFFDQGGYRWFVSLSFRTVVQEHVFQGCTFSEVMNVDAKASNVSSHLMNYQTEDETIAWWCEK